MTNLAHTVNAKPQTRFPYHVDASHGWLKVDHGTVDDLGLTWRDFSEHSYVDAHFFYLEEDFDMTTFMRKYEEVYGRSALVLELCDGERSPIRRLKANHN